MQIQEENITFNGDSSRALDTALRTLLPLGFEIESQGSGYLALKGPGMNSTRQNALQGISHAEFSANRGSLRVRAELGGVDRMQRFLVFLLIGLGLFDSLVFIGLWYFLDPLRAHPWFLVIPLITFIPWIIIGPLLARWIDKRTREALGVLLHNMAMLS
jgi:hypothetical protein